MSYTKRMLPRYKENAIYTPLMMLMIERVKQIQKDKYNFCSFSFLFYSQFWLPYTFCGKGFYLKWMLVASFHFHSNFIIIAGRMDILGEGRNLET